MGGTRRGNTFYPNTGAKMPVEGIIGGGGPWVRPTPNQSMGASVQNPSTPIREYRVRYQLQHQPVFYTYRHWLIVEHRYEPSRNDPWSNEGWLRIQDSDPTWKKIEETAKGQLSDRRWYQLPYVVFDKTQGLLKFSDPGKAMAVKLMMVFE